jgi:hypothetical protein
MDPRMATLNLGLVHLEREGAQRERNGRRSPLVDLCFTAATSAGSGQDGDGSAHGSPPPDDLRRRDLGLARPQPPPSPGPSPNPPLQRESPTAAILDSLLGCARGYLLQWCGGEMSERWLWRLGFRADSSLPLRSNARQDAAGLNPPQRDKIFVSLVLLCIYLLFTFLEIALSLVT